MDPHPDPERHHSDNELIETLRPLLHDPNLDQTAEAAEVFTNGACWYLAWWLHQLTGHPIGAIGGYTADDQDEEDEPAGSGRWDGFLWTHLGLLVDDTVFVDVTGPGDPDEMMDHHLDDEGEDQGIHVVPASEFPTVIFDPTQMSDGAAEITRTVAKLVITRHRLLSDADTAV